LGFSVVHLNRKFCIKIKKKIKFSARIPR